MKQLKQNGIWMVLVGCSMLAMVTFNGCKKEDPKPVVSAPVNKAPVAKAGDDRQVEIGGVVKLDATGSTDPENDPLVYNWSFISKPQESQAVIIGVGKDQAEFTLDKAGDYMVLLKVSDGKLETTDSITITNLTPIINSVYFSPNSFSDKFIVRGGIITIVGKHWGEDPWAIHASIGGVECEIQDFGNVEQFMSIYIKVADSVLGGDLTITLGNQSTTWSTPIQVIGFPIRSFVNNNTTLKGRVTTGSENVEIGTRFKPTLDGQILGLGLYLGEGGEFDVTVWDFNSKDIIGSSTLNINAYRTKYVQLTTPIAIKKDHTYIVSVNAKRWYLYTDPNGSGTDNIFPKTYDNIEMLGTDYKITSAKEFPNQKTAYHYITAGAQIVFSPDF